MFFQFWSRVRRAPYVPYLGWHGEHTRLPSGHYMSGKKRCGLRRHHVHLLVKISRAAATSSRFFRSTKDLFIWSAGAHYDLNHGEIYMGQN